MRKIAIYFSLFFSFFALSIGQENPKFYYGGSIYYNYNIHFPNFTKLGQIPNCCPNFNGGSGSGFTAALFVEFPIIKKINAGLKINYSTLSGFLLEQENIGNQAVYVNGVETTREVWVDHSIDARISVVGFEPYLNYKFFDLISSNIGFTIGYQSQSVFDQKEEIIKPENTTFYPTNSLVRNEYYDMEIPGKNSMLFFANFGLGYEIKFQKDWILTPEIEYSLPLNNLGLNDWKVASVKLGLSLKIPVYPKKELPIQFDTLYIRDTTVIVRYDINKDKITLTNRDIIKEKVETENSIIERTTIKESYYLEKAMNYKIDLSLETVGITSDGEKISNPIMKIEEFESEELFPLLPYIFFEKADWKLSNTNLHILTKEGTKEFDIENLNWEVMEIYKDVLNIIAYRLKQFPDEKIKIIGCNNDKDEEYNNLTLSRKRAISVQQYFTNIWGIDKSRIQISVQNLPDVPGNINDPDGLVENQRVEINPSNYKIIAPIIHKDILKKSNPPMVGIYPKYKSKFELANYDIVVKQSDEVLRKYSGNQLPGEILWVVADKPVPKMETPIEFDYRVVDENGKTADTSSKLIIKQVTIHQKRYVVKDDKVIERYHLILFDFDSYELKDNHKIILDEIKNRIQTDSKVKISGYTDRIGARDYNKNLALKRCEEVRKYLKLDKNKVIIVPVGPDVLLYDNDLPQGRNYCRTVIIDIETPVKK